MTESPPPTASTVPTEQDAPPAYDPNRTGWVPPPAMPPRRPSPFRSAGTRARLLVGLLAANVALAIIGAAISAWGKVVIADFEAGTAGIPDLDRFDAVFGFDSTIDLVAFVAAGVAWLAWSSRTVDNEDGLGIGPSQVTPALAIAWWFLPIANLVMPYLIHKEIYQRYHRGLLVGTGIVTLWWLVYIGCNLFGFFVAGTWAAAITFPELQFGLTLYVVYGLATAMSGVIAITMVRRIQARADFLAVSGPPVPLPLPGVTTSA
jgi:hypothetical protein